MVVFPVPPGSLYSITINYDPTTSFHVHLNSLFTLNRSFYPRLFRYRRRRHVSPYKSYKYNKLADKQL